MLKEGITPYEHQQRTADFLTKNPRCFNTSSPGVGKTLSSLMAFLQSEGERLLVLCPLSIMEPSWGGDIKKFTELSYQIAHGSTREKVMQSKSTVVITNHDSVKWIAQNISLVNGFTHLVIDEFTAYKNRTSQRSKALRKITDAIPNVVMLSGTPNSNTILDIWYPALLLDGGTRLGKQFFGFRSQVCTPTQVGPNVNHIQWNDKEYAADEVADRLKDITVRFRFEDCIDIPPNSVHTLELEMPKWLRTKYEQLENEDYLEANGGVVTSIHAGARVKKLMQLLSGAVYDADGEVVKVHQDRYSLIIEMITEREQCVVAFNWKHEREALTQLAEKAGLLFGVIDGSVSNKLRQQHVADFQDGKLDVIFAHPQSASHGLTLTKGTTTIWCSPTYNAEHYSQFNQRIYRAGQTKKTETIRVAYTDSKEIDVYEKLDGKMGRMTELLDLFQALSSG